MVEKNGSDAGGSYSNRRTFLKVGGALAVSAGFAGCTGGDGGDGGSGDGGGGDGGSQGGDGEGGATTSPKENAGVETFTNEAGVEVGATFDDVRELAQEEGEITAYASIDREGWQQWVDAFNASVDGDFEVNYITGTNDKLLSRWDSEYKSDNVQADLLITVTDVQRVWQRGQVMTLESDFFPAWEGMPDKFKDAENNNWIGFRQVLGNYFYNTDMVSDGDAAESWMDLATDDRWADQTLGHDPTPNMNLMSWLWEKEGREYFEGLREQRPRFVDSHTDLARLCGAGEFAAAFTYTHKMGRFAEQLPVDYFPFDPTPSVVSPIVVNNKAPNPNATLLLCNYLASKEGQNAIGKTQYIPIHPEATYEGYPGLYPSDEYEVDTIKPGQYDTEQMIDRWNEIMGDLI